jgi:hypothetical protein
MPGKPVQFEIPADDISRGRGFWGSLFGWQFEKSRGFFEYDVARVDDHLGVAVTDMEPGRRGIRAYFDVDDINAAVTQVKELGGTAGEPRPVPGTGWSVVCSDTEGNEFGLWQDDPSAPGPTY